MFDVVVYTTISFIVKMLRDVSNKKDGRQSRIVSKRPGFIHSRKQTETTIETAKFSKY